MRKRGSLELDFLGKILLIVFFLLVMLGAYVIITGKGTGIIEHIKNLFSFGGTTG